MHSIYDENAVVDDGTCEFTIAFEEEIIYGCTDDNALNFNQNANRGDNSCVYYEGCTAPAAINYNPDAYLDDGSCEFDVAPVTVYRYGCADPLALNYDPRSNRTDQYVCLP